MEISEISNRGLPFYLDFPPGISEIFRLNDSFFGNSTISRFSGNFSRKCLYFLSEFRNFRIFGGMESAHRMPDLLMSKNC